ncbi:hypothetical protein ACFL6S_26580 [Candidatus Poribacteria bacterium]
MAKILWLDNDRVFPKIYILGLIHEGHEVKHALSLSEAIKELDSDKYDLLILDVMMTVRDDEQDLFPDGATNHGQKAGLVFYKEFKERLENDNVSLLVLTIRSDSEIREAFTVAGLPSKNFASKPEVARAEVFLARVAEIIGERQKQ